MVFRTVESRIKKAAGKIKVEGAEVRVRLKVESGLEKAVRTVGQSLAFPVPGCVSVSSAGARGTLGPEQEAEFA